jgi:hypothetical protein
MCNTYDMTKEKREKNIKRGLSKIKNIVDKYAITEEEVKSLMKNKRSVKRLHSSVVYGLLKNFKMLTDLTKTENEVNVNKLT